MEKLWLQSCSVGIRVVIVNSLTALLFFKVHQYLAQVLLL